MKSNMDSSVPVAIPVTTLPPPTVVLVQTASAQQRPAPTAQYVINGEDSYVVELKRRNQLVSSLGICGINAGYNNFGGIGVVVPRIISPLLICGGFEIDLSRGIFVHPVTTISIFAVCGGVKITVPRGVRVECFGLGICGGLQGLETSSNEVRIDAPLVKITGLVVCGGSNVELNVSVEPVAYVRYESPAIEMADQVELNT